MVLSPRSSVDRLLQRAKLEIVRTRADVDHVARSGGSSRPTPTNPAVAADIGLVIEYGGHTGAVVDLTDSAAVIRVGSAQLKVPFGSDVRVDGLTVTAWCPRWGARVAGIHAGM